MHWLFRTLLTIAGNAFALWLANRFVPGFILTANFGQLVFIALVLTLLNFFIKPVLTLVMGPIIVITLGLGILIVNAIILYLLPIIANNIDILKGSIIIQNIPALILATLLISIVNFIIHFAI